MLLSRHRIRRSVRTQLLPMLVTLTVALVALVITAGGAAADRYPTAVNVNGIAVVGPLFFGGLQNSHGCSASVIASPSRDLVITAAHCIQGNGAGIQFAPGYANGRSPYGVWSVSRVYVGPSWAAGGNTQHDYAILKMSPNVIGGHRVLLQNVTGANTLGYSPRPGTLVTVSGYPLGSNDQPITCTNTTYLQSGYPAFNCHGYLGGTSGSPFVARTGRVQMVVGLIGGLHQGGCRDYTSYSPTFGPAVLTLWKRASLGSRADVVPAAGSNGC